jgi:hypothetical protein
MDRMKLELTRRSDVDFTDLS